MFHAGEWGKRSKSSTSRKPRIFVLNVSRSPTYQKAFILEPLVPSGVHAGVEGGGGLEVKNLEHIQKAVFLYSGFLEVYIFATTFRKAFIVGPKVPYPNTPHPTPNLPYPTHTPFQPTLPYPYLPYPTPALPLQYPTLTYSRTSSKSSISVLEFSRILYLCNHLSESIHSWTEGILPLHTTPPPYSTLPHPTLPYPTLPHHTIPLPQPTLPTLTYPTLPYPTPYPTLL